MRLARGVDGVDGVERVDRASEFDAIHDEHVRELAFAKETQFVRLRSEHQQPGPRLGRVALHATAEDLLDGLLVEPAISKRVVRSAGYELEPLKLAGEGFK